MLVLLEAQPVAGGDVFGALRLGLEPRVDGGAQVGVDAQALGEAPLAQPDVGLLQQLAQPAQWLEPGRPVEPVAALRARRVEQADALDVAQHARRPARRLGRLVDGDGVHGPYLTTVVTRFGKQDPPCGRGILASGEGSTDLWTAIRPRP